MDNQTEFLLASVNSGKGRSIEDAQAVMIEAWKQNREKPSLVITDSLLHTLTEYIGLSKIGVEKIKSNIFPFSGKEGRLITTQ